MIAFRRTLFQRLRSPPCKSIQRLALSKMITLIACQMSFRCATSSTWAKEAKTLDVPDPVIIDRDRLLLPCRAEWENLAKGYAKIARKASERFMQMDTAINYAKRKLEEAEHLPSFQIDWLTKLSISMSPTVE